MLTESLRAVVNEALAPYGASLGDGDEIYKDGSTGIKVDAKKGRFRFESAARGGDGPIDVGRLGVWTKDHWEKVS